VNGIKHPYRAGVSAAALRTNICPCPATKVDLCPHAVMTWRNHRAMCHYAHAVPLDDEDVADALDEMLNRGLETAGI